MQTTDIGHKFGIHWRKIGLIVILLSAFAKPSYSQGLNFSKLNLAAYDERWIHYGFIFGVHNSSYRLRYNEAFTTADFDSLHSVTTPGTPGFKVGFIVDVALYPYLSLRATPSFGFYENDVRYRFTDGTALTETVDATLIELPLLLKYKSVRRRNNRMYLLAGLSPVLQASGTKDENDTRDRLETKNFNVNLELGVGTDIFYQYFKFAVELRYSRGLRNLIQLPGNQFNAPLSRLTVHNIGIFIAFEGGPS